MSVHIPEEGFKLVVIAGFFNGKPIWRHIGKIMVKKGKLYINVDRTFNPAGVHNEDPASASILLHAVIYSDEELKRKASYKESAPPPKAGASYNDFDDDIPF